MTFLPPCVSKKPTFPAFASPRTSKQEPFHDKLTVVAVFVIAPEETGAPFDPTSAFYQAENPVSRCSATTQCLHAYALSIAVRRIR